ncbi:MAG TPA: cysteine desulfurase family protein [Clostridiales bacterium]|nr:cysteine desulfurase family protein [Clostridiales bacterium]HQD71833.1 cysteine desulfurase family protein [Clostridiales bacterium]HXK83270.1 cysteine desulfurase family protein [Clostridiales bacterium]
MNIYLDTSATTAVCKVAADAAYSVMTEFYGNPSSIHKKGIEARNILENSRESVASLLGVSPEEIYFTHGGTESNNTAIFGAVNKGKRYGNRIVTTSVEHPSVKEPMKVLEAQGYEVIWLKADKYGDFSVEELYNAVDKRTILVSIMAVNNEVGTILKTEQAAAAIRAAGAPALLHVDGVQAFGKLKINPSRFGIDLMSMSAHKLHGPKGVGALYIKKGTGILPISFGGGQERAMFPGTEAMPAIAGFGAAVKACGDIEHNFYKVANLNGILRSGLGSIRDVYINSPANALPYILNISVKGIPSQVLVNFLSERGIYISAGSACKKGKRSEVLTAMGLPPALIDSAVRISLSRFNTENEMYATLNAIEDAVKRLRL